MTCFALAFGCVTKNKNGKIIEAYFPHPILHPSHELLGALSKIVDYEEKNQFFDIDSSQSQILSSAFSNAQEKDAAHFAKEAQNTSQPLVLVILSTDEKPKSIPEAFLKLQLISHRLIKPHGTELDGIFSVLENLAWTNQGPIDLNELPDRQMQARLKGEHLSVNCVDKFPQMVDYIVPSGIRIADTARVRLGAYVGKGTTVMHEGFINFNAGTDSVSMVEGRISAGVMVGAGSDIGGGASIMGTLSGGGQIRVSVGENSLLGANAGLGFPLGDRCTIESGLYVTAGTKVTLLDATGNEIQTIKARDLAGKADLLFRRNSITGKIECLTNKSAVELNIALHSNN